ncbi:MAG: hypothetical protein RI979_1829, partial [Pseudomonadota bacterium]
MANSVEFNLPGSSFEEVRKIVHAYSSFATKVGLDEVAKVSGINSTIISKSAKFLVDIGVLSSGAQKVATDLGRKLGRAIEHKVVDDERIYWSDCVKSNEKVSKLITTIRIKGGMTEKAFSDHVLYVSGSKSTSGNKTGARCMTDILVASGLVLEADGKLNEKGKELFERLNTYKSWLLTLKVCDPACGSGAFLNQALSYFIEEHKFVDDIIAELTNTPLRLFDTDLQILENNIFGVDINDESVEIAKLSMWLRTAQPGRKLSDLSNNIKCGNSLIDDPAVAGNKAFNWQKEFPTVFEKGGFDVVIGNPPYVRKQALMEHYPEMCAFFEKNFQAATANYDLYALFMEKCFHLINSFGEISFILP